MRASTETLLSIYEWADIMQLNPWEFAQFRDGFPSVNQAQCPFVWYQRSWPHSYISREEVAATIEKAETALAQQLGFWPAPKYLEETVPVPHQMPQYRDWPYNTYMFTPSFSPLAFRTLNLKTGWVLGGGIRAYTEIGDYAVVYSDADGDTIKERATITFATTVTDPDEIGLYFTATDRLNDPLDETWRIRPIRVDITAGTATVVAPAALFVVPRLELSVDPQALDVSVAANFVTNVTAVRVYTDATATDDTPNQGYALWDAMPGNCDSTPCQQASAAICVGESNMEAGLISASYASLDCCNSWRPPNRARVKFRAGMPLVNGRMDRRFADLVAHLAAAWLPNDQCGCERSSRILHYWRAEASEMEANQRSRPIAPVDINHPFGSLRGAVYAWKGIQQFMVSGATHL